MSHHSLLLPDPSEQVCLRHMNTAWQGLLFWRHFISASLPGDEPGICLVFPALLGPAQSRCLVKTSKHWNHDCSNPRDREQWPEREKEKEWLFGNDRFYPFLLTLSTLGWIIWMYISPILLAWTLHKALWVSLCPVTRLVQPRGMAQTYEALDGYYHKL